MNPAPSAPVAVIDIGSNTIKTLVARLGPGGRVEALKNKTLEARIGAGLSAAQPVLGEEGQARALAAIHELLALAAPFRPARHALVATSAVRDATNGQAFRDRVFAATGHPVRILSGQEEADLIGLGLSTDPELQHLRDFYLFDLGGGSLECLVYRDRRAVQALSLRLGCVRMTEKFFADPSAAPSSDACLGLALYTRQQLRAAGFDPQLPAGSPVVFTGGTITAIRLIKAARHGLELADTPATLALPTVEALLDELSGLDLVQRRAIPGLPAGRADVLPAALVTVLAVAETVGCDHLLHSLHNLRWGVAAQLLGSSPEPATPPPNP